MVAVQFFKVICLVLTVLDVTVKAREWIHGAPEVIAETQHGNIVGTILTATNGKSIYAFKALPYAKPPGLFEAPQELESDYRWNYPLRDGTKNPPSCIQHGTSLAPSSHDCLYLNVYTPIRPGTPEVKLPVMVFIYGGLNLLGDSVIYGPHRLMGHSDVVLVVMNYRVGALGFLSTGDEVVYGNNGYKDQAKALEWVQQHIGSFNGNASDVTLFGESAGASAAISHLLSPKSRGLFHRVIAQSGTPLAAWARDRNPVESSQKFAISLNCTDVTNTTVMVTCLRSKSLASLAEMSFKNFYEEASQLKINFGALALVVEDNHPDAFMIEDPLEILKNGNYVKMPVILGATQHEGSAILGTAYSRNLSVGGVDSLVNDPNFVRYELIPTLIDAVALGDEHLGSPISQSLADYYFSPDADLSDFGQITNGLVDMLSVLLFKAPILLTADYLSQYSNETYLYSFEYEGFNSIWSLAVGVLSAIQGVEQPPIEHGVMHADDLIYFWSLPFILTGNDRKFSEMVSKVWTDFATTSNPTPGESLAKWTPYKSETPNYYKLNLVPELLLDYASTNWRKGSNQPITA